MNDGFRHALIRGHPAARIFRRMRFVNANGSPANELLSLLLVAVLLVCHGAFGALHLFEGYGPRVEEHPSAIERGASPGEHPSHRGGGEHLLICSDYAAVIFVVLLGAALALRLGSSRSWVMHAVRRRAGQNLPTAVAFHLPRGPTAPELQVFRL